ncbi:MAG: hypothetical protein ACLFPX_08560 [Candidatus Omnitrophota bacterium]
MKEIEYKNRISQKRHRKYVSIRECKDEKEVRTRVRKSFLYKLSEHNPDDPMEQAPEVYIRKHIDSKKNFEEFNFRTRGFFTIEHEGRPVKVDFSHSLRIRMQWRDKKSSPPKSQLL